MRATLTTALLGLLACVSGCNQMSGYVMNESGQAFYNRKNYAMAAREFQRAVMQNPNNADYAANLATALRKQGDLHGAERAWRHALYADPGHQPSYHGLAEMLVQQGRHTDANGLLTTWAASQPYSPEAHVEMAWLQREMGNPAGAEQSLRQAIRINPNHPPALAGLGQHYEESGRTAEAVRMYQQSLRNDWYQPQVQERLSSLRGFSPGMAQTQAMSPMMSPGTTIAAAPQGPVSFPPTPQLTGAPGTMPAYAQSPEMLAQQPPAITTPQAFASPTQPVTQPMMMSQPGMMTAQGLPAQTSSLSLPPQPIPDAQFSEGSTPTVASDPFGTPVTVNPQTQSFEQPIQIQADGETINADPAHVPQISSVPEQVQPF